MKCTFDIPYRINDSFALKDINTTGFHWKENENGDQVFEPITDTYRRRFGKAGMITGLCWLLLMLGTTDFLAWGMILTGAILFLIGGRLLGWMVDQAIGKEPLLTIRPNGDIVLHRLKQTISPDATSRLEYDKVAVRPPSRQGNNYRYELILWHGDQSYYLATGKRSGNSYSHRSCLEQLAADLREKVPAIKQEPLAKERFPSSGLGFGCFLWFLLPIGLGFCLIACWTAMFFLHEINLGNESRNWPRVKGRVTESVLWEYSERSGGGGRSSSVSTKKFQEHIVYEYEVDGKEFKNDRVAFKGDQTRRGGVGSQSRGLHQSIVDRYPVGKTVIVRYRSDNPVFSVLEPGRSDWAVNSFIVALFFFFIGSLIVNAFFLFALPKKEHRITNK